MNNKLLVAGAVVLAFAAGRYLTPVKIETRTVEVERKQTEAEREKHKETRTVEVTKPDGTKETTTTVVEDTNTSKKTNTDKSTQTETTKTYGSSKVTISALAGVDVPNHTYVYGLSATKPVLGPITIGAWLFTNRTVGLSLGLEF